MIENIFKTWWNARKVFKRPKIVFYLGKWVTGLPIYRKNISYPLGICSYDIIWKDKYNTPRFEYPPTINIVFLRRYQLLIWMKQDEDYWEQLLWYLYYSNSNLEESKETWPWMKDGKSTWSDKYIKSKNNV